MCIDVFISHVKMSEDLIGKTLLTYPMMLNIYSLCNFVCILDKLIS